MEKKKKIIIDDIIQKLQDRIQQKKSFCLTQSQIQTICAIFRQIIISQPMLLQLKAPVQICGDTHGQFQDLLNIFKLFGNPNQKSYLFLGDYVDRGKQSLESICLLMAYKIKNPQTMFLLRGNHESSELNRLYGFYDQCKRKSSIKIWKILTITFNYLPIAAVVENKIFCVHGGISPTLKKLQNLNQINRPIEAFQNKQIIDFMWSDPKITIQGWSDNFERGVSYYYGSNSIKHFLKKNDLDLICRSHQVVQEGYQFGFQKSLITIFSAPNYCGDFNNVGAILKVDQNLMCSLQCFQGKPIHVVKRERSLTPAKIQPSTSLKNIINQPENQNNKKKRVTKCSNLDQLKLKQSMSTQSKQSKQSQESQHTLNTII